MASLVGATKLSKSLIEAGTNLLNPPSSTDAILTLLHETESLLSTVGQDPIKSVYNALIPSMKALVSDRLLRSPDSDVRVFAVSCLTEIMRITAPDPPYSDEQMKEIFRVTVEAFGKLADASSRGYKKAESVLGIVSMIRSASMMLDLECDDLVTDMFRQFLDIIRPDHPQPVLLSMETIMITVIDESDEISMDLLDVIMASLKKESQDVTPMASRLVEKVLSSCACKLRPCIMEFLKSTRKSLDMYSSVVMSIFQSEAATTEAHIVVNHKETEEKLDMGTSDKGNRSKRTSRGGTCPANGDDKVRNGNDLKKHLKQGQTENTEVEPKSGSTRRKQRKPSSSINPEGGYSLETPSRKRLHEKEVRDSSLAKKPLAQTKRVKKDSEGPSMDTPIPDSSKSKETNRIESGEKLVGKRVKVWWPLDKMFYEGVISSFSSRKNMHVVSYPDGDVEELTLRKERWEIIQDNASASEDKEIDLPDSIPLCDIIRRLRATKSKKVSTNVELSSSPDARSSLRTMKNKHLVVTNSTKQVKGIICALKAVSREEGNLNSSKELNAKLGRTKDKAGKTQKVTRAMDSVSEKDCDGKGEPETKGGDGLKSKKERNAEPECMRDHQDLPEGVETKTDGEELKSTNKPNAEPDSDLEEQEEAKEPIAEPKTDGEEQNPVKEPNAEPETEVQEPSVDTKMIEKEDMSVEEKESNTESECKRSHQEVPEDPNAETKADKEELKSINKPNGEHETDEEEQNSEKEPNAEPETEVEERESEKEPTVNTKLIEKEDMSEEKSDRETYTSVSESGKVENEAEEDDQTVVKELKEETDKSEVGLNPVSG
ncbi:unnamed protein product [Cochlearia groenlandica]